MTMVLRLNVQHKIHDGELVPRTAMANGQRLMDDCSWNVRGSFQQAAFL